MRAAVARGARAIADRSGTSEPDPRGLSTTTLVAQIVSEHHEYLRQALPFVVPLAAKVGRVRGARNPKLRELDGAVRELADTLVAHLDAQEQTLFPALLGKEPDRGVVARVLGDLASDAMCRRIGGIANAVALALFLVAVLWARARSHERPR